jgi:hypothetical protein
MTSPSHFIRTFLSLQRAINHRRQSLALVSLVSRLSQQASFSVSLAVMKLTVLLIASAVLACTMATPTKSPSEPESTAATATKKSIYEPEDPSLFIRKAEDDEGEGDDIRLTPEQKKELGWDDDDDSLDKDYIRKEGQRDEGDDIRYTDDQKTLLFGSDEKNSTEAAKDDETSENPKN